MNEKLVEYHNNLERQEALEHRDVLLAIAAIIKQPEGLKLFRYLFKYFNVAELPDQSMTGNLLHEYLGFLRAGNSIYKLVCEADAMIAASVLSKLEREKYDRLNEQYRLEQELNT
jgi:hypothetical protein